MMMMMMMMTIITIIIITIEPPVNDHPKCQAWSLTRAQTILGQNFASLAYDNYR